MGVFCSGFTIWREKETGFNTTELSQQVQPVPPLHGGANTNPTESQPAGTGSKPSQPQRVLRLIGIAFSYCQLQVLQLQTSWLEMQLWWPLLQPLIVKSLFSLSLSSWLENSVQIFEKRLLGSKILLTFSGVIRRSLA